MKRAQWVRVQYPVPVDVLMAGLANGTYRLGRYGDVYRLVN